MLVFTEFFLVDFLVVSWRIGDEGGGCWYFICGGQSIFIMGRERYGKRMDEGTKGQWK